jgi:hypothetical protein
MVYVGQPYPSNILEIASELKPIQIFPNPTQDLIHVRVDSKNLGSMYVIYDYSGKTVLNGKISSESMAIELADLPYGNYVLTLTSQTDGQVSVVKISKQGR